MEKLFLVEQNIQVWGDSTNLGDYKIALGDCKANLLLADPPYCLLTRRRKKGDLRDPKKAKINHESVTRFETVSDFTSFSRQWMEAAVQFLNDEAVLCIWINFFGKDPIKKVAIDLGYHHFLGEYVWAKLTREGSGNEQLARIYEVALIFSKYPQKSLSDSDLPRSFSCIESYDSCGEATKWGNHPNHKPFTVLEPLIRSYSRPGDRILDPFSGSGSTSSAAIRLNRQVSSIEISEEWCAISRQRINDAIFSK